MSIDSRHPDYAWMEPHLQKCHDAAEGSRSIKDPTRAKRYLPPLKREDDADYAVRLDRSMWLGATETTVEAMTGLLTRKDPELEAPSEMDHFLQKTGKKHGDVLTITAVALQAVIVGGYAWHAVDIDSLTGRLAIVTYSSLDVINWRYSDIGELDLVVIERDVYRQKSSEDPYEVDRETEWLELYLDEEGRYTTRLWTLDEDEQWRTETTVPIYSGKVLDYIPVSISGHIGQKPAIEALADINIGHYRNNSDYEEGCHLTALPKPYVLGASEEEMNKPFLLGAKTSWKTTRPKSESEVGFMEFTGQGLKSLLDAMNSKEGAMASAGARLVEGPRTGVEAAETARIHLASKNATLSDIANDVEQGLRRAFQMAADWAGLDSRAVKYTINREFSSERLEANDIVALVQAYQAGGMSLKEFVLNMQRGERLSRTTTLEEELERIRAENPDVMAEFNIS